MAKLTLNDVSNLVDTTTAQSTINNNNASIEAALENTLSRDGTGPNQMNATLDMNSKQIINLPNPIGGTSPLRLQDLSDFNEGGTIATVPDAGTANQVLAKNSNVDYDLKWANSVSSVALSTPPEFTVTGSPITNTGTLAFSKVPQNLWTFYAAPSSGPAQGTPSFRFITGGDLPAPQVSSRGAVLSKAATTNQFLTSVNTDGTVSSAQPALTDISGLGTGVATFLATPNSTNLRSVVTDETGVGGSLVFSTSPSLTTPSLGAATATSVNKVTITAPSTGATLTIPNGVTLTGPASSGTAMTLENTETITGVKTFGSGATPLFAGTTSGTTALKASATATGTLTLPATTDTLVGKATTDTLTNKTLTSPVITTPTGIVKSDVGLSNVDNTSDATKNSATATLTNKTIDTAGTNTIKINGNSLSATAGTATVTVPNTTDTLVGRATTDTLTNKTLTSPVISTITNSGTLTLPTSTDTLVGRTTTDTLTNKTLTSPVLTTPSLGVATATSLNGVTVDNSPWSSYSPTVTATGGTGTPSFTGGLKYKLFGKTVFYSTVLVITNANTSTGNIVFSLPFTLAGNCAGTGKETSSTGKVVTVEGISGGTTLTTRFGDAAGSTCTTGYTLVISGVLEIQ